MWALIGIGSEEPDDIEIIATARSAEQLKQFLNLSSIYGMPNQIGYEVQSPLPYIRWYYLNDLGRDEWLAELPKGTKVYGRDTKTLQIKMVVAVL